MQFETSANLICGGRSDLTSTFTAAGLAFSYSQDLESIVSHQQQTQSSNKSTYTLEHAPHLRERPLSNPRAQLATNKGDPGVKSRRHQEVGQDGEGEGADRG